MKITMKMIDLTLPENQKYVLDNSVELEVSEETDVDQAEVDRVLAELEAKERNQNKESGSGDGRLTQRELDLKNTLLTEDEIKEALSKVSLPGLDEWGITAPKLDGGRNIDGLPVLDQANAFDPARNGEDFKNDTVSAEYFAKTAEEIAEDTN